MSSDCFFFLVEELLNCVEVEKESALVLGVDHPRYEEQSRQVVKEKVSQVKTNDQQQLFQLAQARDQNPKGQPLYELIVKLFGLEYLVASPNGITESN